MKPFSQNIKKCFPVLAVLLLITIMVNACTDNPFASAPIVSSPNQIFGKISYLPSDSLSMPRALVWLEALNLGTFTDAQGNFRLVLPSPNVQPGGGYTGSSNVYFYVANYTIDSIRVVLHNGEFVYDRGVVDENGGISKAITLRQLLMVDVTAEPVVLTSEFEGELSVYTTLTPINTSLQIAVLGEKNDDIGCVGLQLTGEGDAYAQLLKRPQANLQIREIDSQTTWQSRFTIAPYELRLGKYRIVPFIWIKNNLPPASLLAYLGAQSFSFEKPFLNIPFYRNDMFITVVEPK